MMAATMCLSLALTLIGSGLIAQTPVADFESVDSALNTREFSETTAKQFAEQFGDDAVPILLEMLRSPETGKFQKGKISFYLGVMGVTSALPDIIRFIDAPLSGEISRSHDKGIYFATAAIGYLAGRDDEAFSYLMNLNSEDYWRERVLKEGFSLEGIPTDRTVRWLVSHGYAALSCTGTTEGLAAINSLRQSPGVRSVEGIDEATMALQQRIKRNMFTPGS